MFLSIGKEKILYSAVMGNFILFYFFFNATNYLIYDIRLSLVELCSCLFLYAYKNAYMYITNLYIILKVMLLLEKIIIIIGSNEIRAPKTIFDAEVMFWIIFCLIHIN